MKKRICYYHNDLDGHCAGAIVRMKYPHCEMQEINYGYSSLEFQEQAKWKDEVIVVDFSLVEDDVQFCIESGVKLIWIDHHDSAIKRLEKFPNIAGLRSPDKAGCELTWEYFYPKKAMPLAVHLTGRWDIWDHSNPNTIPFHRGMSMMETDPHNDESFQAWQELFDNDRTGSNKDWNVFDQVMSMGVISEAMKAKYDKFIARNAYYLPDWEGFRTVALNSNVMDSYFLIDVAEKFEEYDPQLLVWYVQTPSGSWYYSLRSYPGTDTVVNTLAEKYEGGGHPGAAGFEIKDLIIKP